MWLVLPEWQGYGRSYVPLDVDLLVQQCTIADASVVEFCDRNPRDANRVSHAMSALFQWARDRVCGVWPVGVTLGSTVR